MLIKQINEFESRCLSSLAVHVLLLLINFMKKQKFLTENLGMDYYLLLKHCRRECVLLPSTWANPHTKFNSKMHDVKRVFDLNCKYNEDCIIKFFSDWLSNVKNLVLSNVIQWY